MTDLTADQIAARAIQAWLARNTAHIELADLELVELTEPAEAWDDANE